VSKQHSVIPSQVFELEDGSSSYKDFSMTRNNRFSSAGQASKNIIQPPSAVLHFYNVPPCVSQDHLLRVGVPAPSVVPTSTVQIHPSSGVSDHPRHSPLWGNLGQRTQQMFCEVKISDTLL
jgi:hypothetical protein